MSTGKTLTVLNQMVADGIVRQYAITGAVAGLTYIEPGVTEDLRASADRRFHRTARGALNAIGSKRRHAAQESGLPPRDAG